MLILTFNIIMSLLFTISIKYNIINIILMFRSCQYILAQHKLNAISFFFLNNLITQRCERFISIINNK